MLGFETLRQERTNSHYISWLVQHKPMSQQVMVCLRQHWTTIVKGFVR